MEETQDELERPQRFEEAQVELDVPQRFLAFLMIIGATTTSLEIVKTAWKKKMLDIHPDKSNQDKNQVIFFVFFSVFHL